MTVRVLTTCHTQYTWDSSICIFLFNRTTLQVFVTYVTGALYLHPLWFHKNQHENQFRSELFVACQRRWFQWQFWFAPSLPGEIRNYCTQHIIKENFENFLIHRCNYILYPDNHFEWPSIAALILNNSKFWCDKLQAPAAFTTEEIFPGTQEIRCLDKSDDRLVSCQ